MGAIYPDAGLDTRLLMRGPLPLMHAAGHL